MEDRPMLWFDREFPLDIPLWMFPNVMERLRGTPTRLVERCAATSRESLVERPEPDRWSIQENVGHLLDLEPLWLGRVDDLESGRARLREADLSNRRTHEANHGERPIVLLLEELGAARRTLVRRLEHLASRDPERTALHPRLERPMRAVDLAFFVAEHDDHHLAEITRLLGRSRPRE